MTLRALADSEGEAKEAVPPVVDKKAIRQNVTSYQGLDVLDRERRFEYLESAYSEGHACNRDNQAHIKCIDLVRHRASRWRVNWHYSGWLYLQRLNDPRIYSGRRCARID